MMHVNSRNWIYLFLFYGLVCFGLGFLGFWGKRGNGSLTDKAPAPSYFNQHNPAAQSEKYVMDWLAGLTANPRKDTAVPVLANASSPALLFCFPENERSRAFRSFIEQRKSSFKHFFAKVDLIPISNRRNWEKVIAPVLDRDPQPILIGVNSTGVNLNATETGVNIHLYFSIPDQCRGSYLLCVPKFSAVLNSFILEKQRSGNRELFRLAWEESPDRYLIKLDQIINILIEVLEQQQVVRQIKRI
jgi:hypothetical protein